MMTAEIIVRPYRGRVDHPDMNRVAAAARLHNNDAEIGTLADLDNHYAHLPFAELERDCVLAEQDGAVVAYARASWEKLARGDGVVTGLAFVDPSARGVGVERLLFAHLLGRAREIAAERAPSMPTTFVLLAMGRHPEFRALADEAGMQVVRRTAAMVRPNLEEIPDIALPEGFETRPIEPDDRQMHRRVFDADARAFADSAGQEAVTEDTFEEFVGSPRFAPALWRVAFHGNEIAGQILNFMGAPGTEEEGTGFTEAISVQPEFRRRGLARALLAASLRGVRDAGARRAALGVDTQNPNQALTLYESLGFRVVSEGFEHSLTIPAPREATGGTR
jgi:mycothiol synthase